MKRAMRIGFAALVGLMAGATVPARADLTFTDQASFLANVQPGYYLETFDSLPGYTDLGPSVSFSGNGFSYDATNPDGLYTTTPTMSGDVALSTYDSGQSITITFTGAPVTAVGGDIYGSDISGNYTAGAITMQLDDGSSITLPNPSPTSFAGFIASSPIASVTIFPEGFDPGYYATLNNLIVGVSAVPEPSNRIFGALAGLAGMGYAWRRRKMTAVA